MNDTNKRLQDGAEVYNKNKAQFSKKPAVRVGMIVFICFLILLYRIILYIVLALNKEGLDSLRRSDLDYFDVLMHLPIGVLIWWISYQFDKAKYHGIVSIIRWIAVSVCVALIVFAVIAYLNDPIK